MLADGDKEVSKLIPRASRNLLWMLNAKDLRVVKQNALGVVFPDPSDQLVSLAESH
jgi:hypothetical protein